MNFCQSDIPGASLNRRLPAYETYRPRFDATREALCIACIHGGDIFYRDCIFVSSSIAILPMA